MKRGKLYLIPSAIARGVAQEMLTPQIKDVLINTKYFIDEHARGARRFISSLKLGVTIDGLEFTEINKRTSEDQYLKMLKPVMDGDNLGVLSDAGCPGIADPGAEIVREAHRQKIKVVPLIGPSSIVLGLMASGLSGQNFRFTGYLPIDKKELKQRILYLEGQSGKEKETQIFIETPYRADKLLEQLISTLQPSTLLTLAKDLTGPNEEIITLPVSSWKKNKITIGKIPSVFLFMAT